MMWRFSGFFFRPFGSWKGVSQTKRPFHAPQQFQNPSLKATTIHPHKEKKFKLREKIGGLNLAQKEILTVFSFGTNITSVKIAQFKES